MLDSERVYLDGWNASIKHLQSVRPTQLDVACESICYLANRVMLGSKNFGDMPVHELSVLKAQGAYDCMKEFELTRKIPDEKHE